MVTATIGTTPYKTSIQINNHLIISDEPIELGGQDLGTDPMHLLMASLAGCIAMTLRMYIERKQWDIPKLTVEVSMRRTEEETHFYRHLLVPSAVDDKTLKRLYQIASKCPVSKIIKGNVAMHDGPPEATLQ